MKFLFTLAIAVFLCGLAMPVFGSSIAPPGGVALETQNDLNLMRPACRPAAIRFPKFFPEAMESALCAPSKKTPTNPSAWPKKSET